MVEFYDLDIIPIILKHFKVNTIIINDLSDKKIIDEILNYDANVVAISKDNPHNFDLKIIDGNHLDVLQKLNNYDAIFINDDPNWYNIFNQLNIIKKTNDEFPLVFICNNRFPHKRRDAYLNPNSVPNEFLNDFSEYLSINYKGKDILIKDKYYHAIAENTSKNGVLTAIEDFLKSTFEVSMMKIQFIDEISILYPKSTISQIRIDKIMKDIENKTVSNDELSSSKTENKILLSYISDNDISISNLDEINSLKSELLEQNEMINDFESKIKNYNNEIEYKNSKIGGVESQLGLKNSQITNLESKLLNKDFEIENLYNQITNLKNNLDENELKYIKSEQYFQNKINDRIKVLEGVFNSFENQIGDLIENNEENSNKLKLTTLKLKDNQKSINYFKKEHTNLYSKLDSREYCISCFKDELSNKKFEIQYMKSNSFVRSIFSPLSYLIIILKSNPKDLALNLKLFKTLKDSNCFDIGYYLKNNVDLINSSWYKYFSPELHYVCNGFNENRKFNKKYFNRNSKKQLLEYLAKCEKT